MCLCELIHQHTQWCHDVKLVWCRISYAQSIFEFNQQFFKQLDPLLRRPGLGKDIHDTITWYQHHQIDDLVKWSLE